MDIKWTVGSQRRELLVSSSLMDLCVTDKTCCSIRARLPSTVGCLLPDTYAGCKVFYGRQRPSSDFRMTKLPSDEHRKRCDPRDFCPSIFLKQNVYARSVPLLLNGVRFFAFFVRGVSLLIEVFFCGCEYAFRCPGETWITKTCTRPQTFRDKHFW